MQKRNKRETRNNLHITSEQNVAESVSQFPILGFIKIVSNFSVMLKLKASFIFVICIAQ